MENECEALPGVAYPGVRDNRSTINTKTGYDDDDVLTCCAFFSAITPVAVRQITVGIGKALLKTRTDVYSNIRITFQEKERFV